MLRVVGGRVVSEKVLGQQSSGVFTAWRTNVPRIHGVSARGAKTVAGGPSISKRRSRSSKDNEGEPGVNATNVESDLGNVSSVKGGLLQKFIDPDETPAERDAPPGSDRQRKGEYMSTADRKRERMASIFTWSFFAGLIGGGLYLGHLAPTPMEQRRWPDFPTGSGPSAYWGRFKLRVGSFMSYYNEPAFEKLLPDPPPPAYARPYTLVVELNDLLVHSEWTREHGWRTAKRPGLDYFLGYLSQYYEVIVFTEQYAATSIPIVAKIDPYHSCVSGSLFREATKYENGKFIKDLSYMNRDLSKVVLVDTNPDAGSAQPENTIIIRPWTGNADDTELVAYVPFLEFLASQNFTDLRPILKQYADTDIPREYMRREATAKKVYVETRQEEISKQRNFSWLSSVISGTRKRNDTSDIKTPLEEQRERAQNGYLDFQKYLKEHGEQILQEDKMREKEELAKLPKSLSGWFSRGEHEWQRTTIG